MNPKWFGDSYDIVKRFFASSLRKLGYEVYIDPMLTGAWGGDVDNLYRFLKMRPVDEYTNSMSALFLDPDTGIGRSTSPKHTTIQTIGSHLQNHEIVFAFDQSFSRGPDARPQIQEKLSALRALNATGVYFDSHARFLFASFERARLEALQDYLGKVGLPKNRFVSLESPHRQ